MNLKRAAKRTVGVLFLGGTVLFLAAYALSDNDCDDGAAAPRDPMTAVVFCDYGGPGVLRLAQVEKPVPGDSQVLVRVRAGALNPVDWHYMRGTPYLGRVAMGLRKPKDTRFGVDFAGTVEAVGSAVTQFKPGDEVFGRASGALAQYVTVYAHRGVVLKPSRLTHEEAAAIPVAAVTALQALRDNGEVQPGQKVLINGASGGVGTFAVQIAKALGAEVTGVSSTRNVELVRSLGADHVIDYTREDFTRTAERYDVIIDNVGNHSLCDLRSILKPDGNYVMVGGGSGKWVDPLPRAFRTIIMGKFVSQDMRFFIASINQKDLTFLRELVEAGQLTPAIDRRYRLDEVREAIAYMETGRARAKVVLTVH
jgi:NADPH:quinone reductase-like Zn-dependent oxidoreductase